MTEGSWGIPWRKALAEGALIIASVYIAIVLQGISDDRERVQDALASLEQLEGDLEADRADLAEIMAEQEDLDGTYGKVLDWLAEPSRFGDSIQVALDRIAYSNRTVFPRRGAWTTLISGGQLIWIDDRALVSHLGTFYERVNERLEYNGRDYDFSLNAIARETISAVWDPVAHRPMTGAEAGVPKLRNQLRFMHLFWNRFYLDLLRSYSAELDALLAEVRAYLGETKSPAPEDR